MNSKTNKGFIPVIIILVVLFGIGGVYFYGTSKPKPVVESPIPTLDPLTSNWKEYTHIDNLYTIRYPSDVFIVRENRIDKTTATVCKGELILVNIKNKSSIVNYEDGNIIIDVCMNPEQADFPSTVFSNIDGPQLETKIDNQNAYVKTGTANLAKLGMNKELSRVAVYNKGQYTFDFIGGMKNKTDYGLFMQILSTFKFILN